MITNEYAFDCTVDFLSIREGYIKIEALSNEKLSKQFKKRKLSHFQLSFFFFQIFFVLVAATLKVLCLPSSANANFRKPRFHFIQKMV
jgi:hypothetical protein